MPENNKSESFILMADDDPEYYDLTMAALKETGSGAELRRVEDGQQLIDYLKSSAQKPAFILLDLNMPKKDGFQALKEIKGSTEFRHIPVIMMTISNNPTEVKLSYFLGANSFVTKPIGFEPLVKTLTHIQNYWFQAVRLPSAESWAF